MTGPVLKDETGAQRLLGYMLDLSDPAQGTVTLTVLPEHTNRTGRLHGGIVAALLDSAMGGAASLAWDDGGHYPVVTISMTVNYIASGAEGEHLTATGHVTGGGRKIKFCDGRLEAKGGRLIATATGTFKSVAPR
ncbi:hypothetical protein PARPLA_01601 [Rhodobacteraceae bacterium THAF1]|uniref:PaaI family thioesterase n=1 Tax=Palleronia sp. THAF1 TaxID=2587842 RepID=UPI000F40FC64|nr:PaaI family thioesterase [Palleronia sp. THAF1]QFU07687.1 hypothetical protein FIU81_03250 [Palleronia sp. THAF1]VDC23143.1 hypothetical protein PARPLA_01601 [Rhodobacteraceae bacterium THAF1]